MIGALIISAGIGYFYTLPFAAIFQGSNYRIRGYFLRSKRYLILSAVYLLVMSAVILTVEWVWDSTLRYLFYFFCYVTTASFLFAIKGKMRMPIVVTNRLIRLLVASCILYLLLFFPLIFCRGKHLWAVLPVFTPFVLPVAALIIAPFEKRNNEKYIERAKRSIAESKATVIGITGSYGKTSVKKDLERLLSLRFDTLASPANYNTPLGVARTMQTATGREDILIFEMGARREGDISELCDICRPKIGVLTGIAPQHLESFGSIEAIMQEKGKLVKSLPPDGIAFFNLMDPLVRELYDHFDGRKIGVGESCAEYLLSEIAYEEEGMYFCLTKGEESLELHLPLWGKAAVIDFALSAAIAWELDVDIAAIKEEAKRMTPSPHRFEVMRTGDVTIIDDSYNINPIGASVALDSLGLMKGGRKIVYTCGMVELGEEGRALNESLGRKIAEVASEVVLGGGKYGEEVAAGLSASGFSDDRIHRVRGTEEATGLFHSVLRKGDVLLIMSDLPRDYLI